MSPKVAADLGDKIKRLLALGNRGALRRLLARHNFADIAEVLDNGLSEEEAVTCFQFLNVGQAAQVLTSLTEERQKLCLSSLPAMMSSKILREMPADDAVDILQELDPSESSKILGEMPFDTETRTIHHLLMEEPDTAAGLMSPDFIQTSVEGTVGDALALIKRAEEKDFIYYCYLVDSEGKLVGVVSLKQLILVDESVPLQRIATFDVKSLLLTFDQELVANVFRKYYNLLAMPVVDQDEVLRGIITLDDIVDVIDEESSEDYYQASGITMEAIDEKHLLTGPMLGAVKARLPWLGVTLCGQFLAASIIAGYADTVRHAVIAISFMPLLTGLSGNMGTQSESISVRGLALGLITDASFRNLLWRELKVALTMGLTLAIGFSILSFIKYQHWELTLLLFIAITVNLCLAGSLGMLIPYTYRRVFKKDPAGVGGPFITTLMDILTFSTYLYVLTYFLKDMI
jgi:magnesium transporter